MSTNWFNRIRDRVSNATLWLCVAGSSALSACTSGQSFGARETLKPAEDAGLPLVKELGGLIQTVTIVVGPVVFIILGFLFLRSLAQTKNVKELVIRMSLVVAVVLAVMGVFGIFDFGAVATGTQGIFRQVFPAG